MIKALRITLTGMIPFEHVEINSHFLDGVMPHHEDIFEDAQLMFTCKHGKYMVPDYNVVLIQMHNKRTTPPDDAYRVKRILLSYDLNYQDCYIVRQKDYDRYGIPQVFREFEQLTFICKDGLFITTDFQVEYIQLY